MKITCLGTGSPEPDLKRASAGYLAEVGDDKILFDCGGGVFGRLLQAGHQPYDITHIFFSHLHSDHMMDYARLVHAAWDVRAAPLAVFGPAPIAGITDKLFGADGVFAHDLTARTEHPASQTVWKARGGQLPRPWPYPRVTEIARPQTKARTQCVYESGGWTVSVCTVPHVQPYLDCFALRLDAAGAAFVYSGDAAICKNLEALSANADLLLHWCYRFDDPEDLPDIAKLAPGPRAIAGLAARAGVRRLLLTHLRPSMDTAPQRRAALAQVREVFGGEAGIAEDLQQIILPQ